jgi:hypothetical protein
MLPKVFFNYIWLYPYCDEQLKPLSEKRNLQMKSDGKLGGYVWPNCINSLW